MDKPHPPFALFVIGPSGCGKSTVGRELASRFRARFLEADDYHSQSNRAKMASGTPLTDEDRLPWLHELHRAILQSQQSGESVVLACSALKESYRRILAKDIHHFQLIWLDCSPATLAKRISSRTDHFMPLSLLQSQIDTFEEPCEGLRVNADRSPKEILGDILTAPSVLSITPKD